MMVPAGFFRCKGAISACEVKIRDADKQAIRQYNQNPGSPKCRKDLIAPVFLQHPLLFKKISGDWV
jgi:hypothetical protein